MRICLIIGADARQWHRVLAARLLREPQHEIFLAKTNSASRLPRSLPHTLSFERLVYGITDACALDVVDFNEFASLKLAADHQPTQPFDVVVRLDGSTSDGPSAERTLTPLFDFIGDEVGALSAILDVRPLHIGLLEETEAETRTTTYLAETELPTIVAKSVNIACERVIDLIALRIDGVPLPRLGATVSTGRASIEIEKMLSANLIFHTSLALAKRLKRRLDTLARGGDRWAIGWRRANGDQLQISGPHRDFHYSLITDDRRRFFADPFPFSYRGRSYLFCEEFPYATGKGLISVVALDEPSIKATPILEEPHHLSYPMIFEVENQLWMIPEAGTSNSVTLYRCIEFPHRWSREAVILEEVSAADPTIHRDKHGYWLFFTSCAGPGSPSDRLCLYRAPALLGPWEPCGAQPLAIDPTLSRPAGHMLRQNAKIYRPTQDCSKRYGGDIIWCSVDELRPGTFAQHEIGRFAPADRRMFPGAHTYNFHQGIETIDVFGAPRGQTCEFTYRSDQCMPHALETADWFTPASLDEAPHAHP